MFTGDQSVYQSGLVTIHASMPDDSGRGILIERRKTEDRRGEGRGLGREIDRAESREGFGLYDSTATGEPSVMPMRNEMVLAQTVRQYCGRRRATALETCPGVFRIAARNSLRANWRKLF